MLKYFVSYIGVQSSNLLDFKCTDSCMLYRDKPVCDEDDIYDMQDDIKKRTGFGSVTIIYWKRFEKE